MEAWVVVLIIIVALMVLDWGFTALYCSMQKKKSKVYRATGDVQETTSEPGATVAAAEAAVAGAGASANASVGADASVGASVGASQPKMSLRSKVRAFIEGYILYKCNMLMYIPSQNLRKLILKLQYMMNLSWKAIIYHGSEFREPWNITIKEGASIGDHAVLDGRNGLVIEHDVNIGSRVFIWSEQHDYNDPYFRCNNKGGMVRIEPRVWLSAGVIVLPKVTVKEGAVIAAGAVVTKSCDAFTLYGGVPAKKIGERNHDLKYSLAETYMHFY